MTRASPEKDAGALRPSDPAKAWLGDPGVWRERTATIAGAAKWSGDKSTACWLPSEGVARVWQAFVAPNPVVKITSPAGLGDKQPFKVFSAGEELTVSVEVTAGTTAQKVILFDLDQPVADALPTGQTCEFRTGKLAPGIHTFVAHAHLASGTTELSRPATIIVARP